MCLLYQNCKHGLHDNARPRRFLLLDGDSDPPSSLEKCGINVVRYPKTDKQFSGLDQILEYWAKKKEPAFREAGVEKSPYNPKVEREQ